MALDVEDAFAGLDPERLRRIEDGAAELIADEMTLRELRKARALTQASVARELGISQNAISRLEQRSDLLLSTLRRTGGGHGRQPVANRVFPTALRSSLPASPNTTPRNRHTDTTN